MTRTSVYDGIHIERLEGEKEVPAERLAAWRAHVNSRTGLDVALQVKEFRKDPDWSEPDSSGKNAVDQVEMDQVVKDREWLEGRVMLGYQDLMRAWERRAFKVVMTGNFVVEDKERDGERVILSDRTLNDAYRHLHFLEVKRRDCGTCEVTLSPFIARWTRDPKLRSYERMDLLPPPLVTPPTTFNIQSRYF